MSDSTPQGNSGCNLCRLVDTKSRRNRDGKERNPVREGIFHSQCARCSSLELAETPTLCDFCRHLRILHLAMCLNWNSIKRIRLGYYTELRQKGSICDLCRFVSSAFLHEGQTWKSLPDPTVYLCFDTPLMTFVAEPANLAENAVTVSVSIWDLAETPELGSKFNLGKYIDWDQVRGWVKSTRRFQRGPSPENLKVIDVQQNRVVDAPMDCEYLALSYVWGDPKRHSPPFRSTFDRDDLPPTIRDAIYACVYMRMRYLWVDQFCIDQDDDDDKREQIRQMNLVYEGAWCTLIAMAGENCNHGLPGVTFPRTWNHSTFEAGNIVIANHAPNIRQSFLSSKWSTRGWTFQETIFSSAVLCFTDCGLHYGYPDDLLKYKWKFKSDAACSNPARDFFPVPKSYGYMLKHYTGRHLTRSTDILPAFEAILVSRYGHGTHFGLPLQNLDMAISWCHNPDKRDTYKKRVGYPSWSWTSHEGPVRTLATTGSFVYWSSPSTPSTKVRPFNHNLWGPGKKNKHWDITALTLVWHTGCVEIPFPIEPNLDSATFEALKKRWPAYQECWEDTFGQYRDTDFFLPQELETAAEDERRILARGQTARFQIEAPDGRINRLDTYWIISDNNELVGLVRVPNYYRIPKKGYQGEFMILSIGSSNGWNMDPDICVHGRHNKQNIDKILEKLNGLIYYDAEGNICPYPGGVQPGLVGKILSVASLNVMLMERKDEDFNITRRLGVGMIFLKRWTEAAHREFKTVILE